jgi:NTE family protein
VKSGSASPGRPPFACVALLLQGGGALGAYQAGVYDALAGADIHPDWIAGISIGAVNAAIIAGNPPQVRSKRLREFWESVTTQPWYADPDWVAPEVAQDEANRRLLHEASAAHAAIAGVPGFFRPRIPNPWLQRSGRREATSLYETRHLRASLERLIDFDRINAGGCRLSVGAVNVESGNFAYFDTTTHRIGVEHVMASSALPPAFPPIQIDGAFYWDGGLVSNTPLQWVLEYGPRCDTLAFQVDLWSARGHVPNNMVDVLVREKEIQYSSRTRANTDRFANMQRLRNTVAKAVARLPPGLRACPEMRPLMAIADRTVFNIVHLIYRPKRYEGHAKDFEFSRLSMEEHWCAGYEDAARALRNPAIFQVPDGEGVFTFDISRDDGA